MAQYLLSVHHDVDGWENPGDDFTEVVTAVDQFNDELQSAGVWVFAGGLESPAASSVVDGRGDQVLTSDGPFAETKEHLGGFWIIEAEDLKAAQSWAAKGSRACRLAVEVRPFQG